MSSSEWPSVRLHVSDVAYTSVCVTKVNCADITVTPCSSVSGYRLFGGKCSLHPQVPNSTASHPLKRSKFDTNPPWEHEAPHLSILPPTSKCLAFRTRIRFSVFLIWLDYIFCQNLISAVWCFINVLFASVFTLPNSNQFVQNSNVVSLLNLHFQLTLSFHLFTDTDVLYLTGTTSHLRGTR